jgi:hypothetical protein
MKIYSPWAEIDTSNAIALSKRLDSLNGKTIGLLSHFKGHSPLMLKVMAELITEKYPDVTFKELQYKRDTSEIYKDPEFDAELKDWLKDVDGVIGAYGDAGSCCMFHAYNCAYLERLNIPTVMLVKEDLLDVGKKSASSRGVHNLRFVPCKIHDLSWAPALDQALVDHVIRPGLSDVLDAVVDGLTVPLTLEEQTPYIKDQTESESFEYTKPLTSISDYFYQKGWTTGLPIIAPTEEAVAEMLRGTDLPRDYVVAEIPPMMGKATVEKIAVNAVMAGCLPTYLPVLIAAVKAIVAPNVHLEGYTCSVASWFPLITVSGKVAKEIGVSMDGAALSGYSKASAAIARAYSYIIMNISGVRPIIEDKCEPGHEARQGVCIGDNMDMSPWKPLHVRYGISEDDSAVTLCWPQERTEGHGFDAKSCFNTMSYIHYQGWDRGCCYMMTPGFANHLAKAGFKSQEEVLNYVCEYVREPATNINYRWMYDNNHLPKNVLLPFDHNASARKFWSTDHLMIVVAGSNYDATCINLAGGGEHGGPSCIKIELPSNWNELLEQYRDLKPDYIPY